MNNNNYDKQMLQAKLQEYILNIPIGEEVNLEVLLRIILQLTDVKSCATKQTLISQVESLVQSYCSKGIIRKEGKRYIRVQKQQELEERE